jgi:hypothetical protein
MDDPNHSDFGCYLMGRGSFCLFMVRKSKASCWCRPPSIAVLIPFLTFFEPLWVVVMVEHDLVGLLSDSKSSFACA